MITTYIYRGRQRDLDCNYIPCLIGTNAAGDVSTEVYFESSIEINPVTIMVISPSNWISHPTRIMRVRFQFEGKVFNSYCLADELLTAGVSIN